MSKEKEIDDFERVYDKIDLVIGPAVKGNGMVQLESGRIEWRLQIAEEDYAMLVKAAEAQGITPEQFFKESVLEVALTAMAQSDGTHHNSD